MPSGVRSSASRSCSCSFSIGLHRDGGHVRPGRDASGGASRGGVSPRGGGGARGVERSHRRGFGHAEGQADASASARRGFAARALHPRRRAAQGVGEVLALPGDERPPSHVGRRAGHPPERSEPRQSAERRGKARHGRARPRDVRPQIRRGAKGSACLASSASCWTARNTEET